MHRPSGAVVAAAVLCLKHLLSQAAGAPLVALTACRNCGSHLKKPNFGSAGGAAASDGPARPWSGSGCLAAKSVAQRFTAAATRDLRSGQGEAAVVRSCSPC